MKTTRLNSHARAIIRSIQLRISLAGIIPPRTMPDKAKLLANIINDTSELYTINQRAPRLIPFYPFCGIPTIVGVIDSFVCTALPKK